MAASRNTVYDKSVYQMTKGWIIYACSKMESTLPEAQNSMHPDILALLKEFDVIFKEPKELPPKWTHDHHIPLIGGAEPINLRPYRHHGNRKMSLRR